MSVENAVDYNLTNADTYSKNNNLTDALCELQNAVTLLTEQGIALLNTLSNTEFDTPLFQISRRITAVFINTDNLGKPQDVISSVQNLFETDTEGEKPDPSKIEILLSCLTSQQNMRDVIFSDGGIYHSAANTAAPYLIGFLAYTGDQFDTAGEKADQILYGPIKHLAELFYSLLTSTYTAGLLLLAIRRLIPIFRPSKTATIVNAAVLTAANIPQLIEGLHAVAYELARLQCIISKTPSERNT